MWLLIAAALVTGGSSAGPLPSALVDAYLQVQVALAADRFEGIAAPARAVEVAATALGQEGEKLADRARALAAAKDIAAARTAFGEMSRELEAYAEKTKSTFPSDVRLAYCPMADKSWRQKGQEIRNPYYGAGMLTCGSFKN
jgi:hypothetical protein